MAGGRDGGAAPPLCGHCTPGQTSWPCAPPLHAPTRPSQACLCWAALERQRGRLCASGWAVHRACRRLLCLRRWGVLRLGGAVGGYRSSRRDWGAPWWEVRQASGVPVGAGGPQARVHRSGLCCLRALGGREVRRSPGLVWVWSSLPTGTSGWGSAPGREGGDQCGQVAARGPLTPETAPLGPCCLWAPLWRTALDPVLYHVVFKGRCRLLRAH